MSVTFGKLKTVKTAKKTTKQFPIFEAESDELNSALNSSVTNSKLIADATAEKKAADAFIRSTIFDKAIQNLQHGSQTTLIKGEKNSILFSITSKFYPKSEDKIPAKFRDRFSTKQSVSIDVNALGENAQVFIDALEKLAVDIGVTDAILVKEDLVPTGDVMDLVKGLSIEDVKALDEGFTLSTMIKKR